MLTKYLRKIGVFALILLIVSVGSGCGTQESKGFWAPIETLIDHPAKTVRYPSSFGGTLGGIVGTPVTIVLLPITVLYAHWHRDTAGVDFLPIAPIFVFAQGGAIIFGGLPWIVYEALDDD